jgi:hypothetical protein
MVVLLSALGVGIFCESLNWYEAARLVMAMHRLFCRSALLRGR